MKRLIAAASLALALAGCASAPRPAMRLRPVANPGAVIAAEIAFSQLAQEKGQWSAFRATAAPDARMFVPQRVRVLDFLKGKPDPAQAVKWQPHLVWSSCDGSVAVTHGAWQRPGSTGYFTTVWMRQADGSYRWVLDHGDRLDAPLPAPEMIAARVAQCTPRPPQPPAWNAAAAGDDTVSAAAADQTLAWSSTVAADGSRSVAVKLWNGSGYDTVLQEQVAAGR